MHFPPNHWVRRLVAIPATHFCLGAFIVWADIATGTFLQFPILFVIPVALCAWFASPRCAYFLAIALPVARMGVAHFIEHSHPLPFVIANAGIRIFVLGFLAYLLVRLSKREREVRERLNTFVTICAWSRTVEFEGEWLSFEAYLARRFGIKSSHGMSPAEFEKAMQQLDAPDKPPS